MREHFVDKNFGAVALNMIDTVNEILESYESQGYDLSLRQLYYQLVSRNIVPNTERSYKNVGTLVSDARLAGLLDWDMIKDRGRETHENPHWSSPGSFLIDAAPQFKLNLWADQNSYVEVMVEKQALEGVLLPVCRGLDVPFTSNKGYSSSSALYEASKRYLKAAEEDKTLYIIYLGDHDPSGIDMSRDIEDRMNMFLNVPMGLGPNEGDLIEVKRIALNMDQVRELRPPENPAKLTDSRATSYIEKFGRSSWELDAIEPRMLAALVSDAIHSVMDASDFNKARQKQEAGRAALLKMAKANKEKL